MASESEHQRCLAFFKNMRYFSYLHFKKTFYLVCPIIPSVTTLSSRCVKGIKPQSIYLITFFVCKACALVHDLNILEDGDESEVGEHGVCHASFAIDSAYRLKYFARRLIFQVDKKQEV